MATQNFNRIGHRPANRVSKMDALRDTWQIMKPLVHFSIKAATVLAHALIFIVKSIPKPENDKKTIIIKRTPVRQNEI